MVLNHESDSGNKLKNKLKKKTLWLAQAKLAVLFERDRAVIGRHICNIFKEEELDENVVFANFAHTTQHGTIV